MNEVVAVCLGFCGVVLFTALLRSGPLTGGPYAVLCLGILVFSYVVWKGDAIQQFNLKDASVTMRQIEQARADVFAKADAVQRMAEQVAEISAWSISTANRFVGDDHTATMLAKRDQLRKMLTESGVAEERIAQILKPIDDVAERDLTHKVREFFQRQLHERNLGKPQSEQLSQETVLTRMEQLLVPLNRAGLIEEARKLNLYSATLERLLADLEYFRQTKRLRAEGREEE